MTNPITWLLDRRLAVYQNDLMEKHLVEVENIYRQMRGWHHDYHNHIQAMQALTYNTHPALEAYLRRLDNDLTTVDTVLKTGNIMVDAIVNSKLSLAKTHAIQIDAAAHVPKELAVQDIDLCVILGNLLDNAMEACNTFENAEQRWLRLYIDIMQQQLYISVQNSSIAKRGSGSYKTTKTEGLHGFGLTRVDRIVHKYNGYVNRQNEEGIFATEIMLPLAL